MSLPSNKIGALLLITVVFVSAIISFNSYQERKDIVVDPEADSDIKVNQIVTVKVDTNPTGTDTDGDGLLDWEEVLWGTDPNDLDSDKDGTSDGAEVAAKRDPMVAGPDDEQSALFAQNASAVPTLYGHRVPGTLTDNLSINLATNYFNLKQNQSYSPETGQELVDAITTDVSAITSQKEIKFDRDGVATVGNDSDSLRKYGLEIATVKVNKIRELKSYESYEEDLYLEIVSKFYIDYSNRLALIYVPTGVAKEHIDIMNNYNNMSKVITDLRNYQTDPVRALLAIRTYEELSADQNAKYSAIANYFSENDIIFSEDNVGNIWNTQF